MGFFAHPPKNDVKDFGDKKGKIPIGLDISQNSNPYLVPGTDLLPLDQNRGKLHIQGKIPVGSRYWGFCPTPEKVKRAGTQIDSTLRLVAASLSLGLLGELRVKEIFSVESLVRDCDHLALVLECIYERRSGVRNPEIESAYALAHQELVKSKWTAVQEFMGTITDHWDELISAH